MSNRWYFAWNNAKFGPFTASELKELAKLGRLQPTDTVWKDGVVVGVMASEVVNLFASNRSAAPPSTGGCAASDGQLEGIIPEKLTLRAIEGTDDSVFLASPWTKSPKRDAIESN